MDIPDYRNSRCLVTGGLGFVGSNLALRLASAGAAVTVIDAVTPGCGANIFNIAEACDRIRVIRADIGDIASLRDETDPPNVIFNLAGEISHTMSMSEPERDMDINARAQLRFLLFCREFCPQARVVYAGTRQVYGRPEYLPADEDHPIQPVDFNGIHKHAAAQYHLLLSRRGELDCVVLRLSNVYGPRMALHLPQQGVLNVFLRNALQRRPLVIYGDGSQVRDPVYVEDAVNAFLLAGRAELRSGRVYNVGGPEPLPLRRMADILTHAAGMPDPVIHPFPCHLRSIDIGSYASDTRRAGRCLDWRPVVSFQDGVRRTLEYYRCCGFDYVNGPHASFSAST